MHGIWKAIGSFVRRADMILLSLCIAASVYGIVVISSATNVNGSAQYVRTQILALVLGIFLYIVFTLIDVDIIAERRELLRRTQERLSRQLADLQRCLDYLTLKLDFYDRACAAQAKGLPLPEYSFARARSVFDCPEKES